MSNQQGPSPDLFFDALTAYQRSAALRSALELDLFTLTGENGATAEELATHSGAAKRGVRILCDYLAINGFLIKTGDRYSLTPSSSVFLNRNSPAYAGAAADFIMSDELTRAFAALTEAVRKGGAAHSEHGTVSHENSVWITFAKTMGGLMVPASHGLAELLPLPSDRATKVLDVAAGHGVWGISIAKKNPRVHLVALDWSPVLAVARENARTAGIADRFSTIAGSAFEVDLGSDYDVVLVPNFLHHFKAADCTRFLKKVGAALRPGGRVAIVEFVPNPDRITPPMAGAFSLVMLATTPEGDAYTLAEYSAMLAESGFQSPQIHPLPSSMNHVIIAAK